MKTTAIKFENAVQMLVSRQGKKDVLKKEQAAILNSITLQDVKANGYANLADFACKVLGWSPATLSKYRTVGSVCTWKTGEGVDFMDSCFNELSFSMIYFLVRRHTERKKGSSTVKLSAIKEDIKAFNITAKTSVHVIEQLVKEQEQQEKPKKQEQQEQEQQEQEQQEQEQQEQTEQQEQEQQIVNAFKLLASVCSADSLELVAVELENMGYAVR